LVRIVRTPAGAVVVDPTGKAAGRGAYLCRQAQCWSTAVRRGTLAGALKVTLTGEDRAAVEAFGASLAAEPASGRAGLPGPSDAASQP
jgi:predicted RNA-binding protein YlxR (DUF448 family)